jgi:hypothetical protein
VVRQFDGRAYRDAGAFYFRRVQLIGGHLAYHDQNYAVALQKLKSVRAI